MAIYGVFRAIYTSAMKSIYLDIETARDGAPTVLGYCCGDGPICQVVRGLGAAAGPARLEATTRLAAFPRGCRLYTFNGTAFDLPRILDAYNVDLAARCDHVDLLYAARAVGHRGGQKALEVRYGACARPRQPPNTWALWDRWARGDGAALAELLAYNAADVAGLAVLARELSRRRGATRPRFG